GRGTIEGSLSRDCRPPRSLGTCGWAILYRSHLVHLFVLSAGFSQPAFWSRAARYGGASVRHLHRGNAGQHQRRLALVGVSATWMDAEQKPQDRVVGER